MRSLNKVAVCSIFCILANFLMTTPAFATLGLDMPPAGFPWLMFLKVVLTFVALCTLLVGLFIFTRLVLYLFRG